MNPQVGDVRYVSLKAFDTSVNRPAVKHGVAVIVRADNKYPVVARPGFLATDEGRWNTNTVHNVRGEKSFHKVSIAALMMSQCNLENVYDFEAKPKIIDLQTALLEVAGGGEVGTTDTEKPDPTMQHTPQSSTKSWSKVARTKFQMNGESDDDYAETEEDADDYSGAAVQKTASRLTQAGVGSEVYGQPRATNRPGRSSSQPMEGAMEMSPRTQPMQMQMQMQALMAPSPPQHPGSPELDGQARRV